MPFPKVKITRCDSSKQEQKIHKSLLTETQTFEKKGKTP
jgi:hypothetical protein